MFKVIVGEKQRRDKQSSVALVDCTLEGSCGSNNITKKLCLALQGKNWQYFFKTSERMSIKVMLFAVTDTPLKSWCLNTLNFYILFIKVQRVGSRWGMRSCFLQ